jgi:glycosyltransferase involved in cell wall biosynthesis
LPATLACLPAALVGFTERGWTTELLVCDNNSTDRTAEIARAAGAKVIFEPMNQIARARNSAVAQATGDWVLIIDADSKPSVEIVRDTAQAIASGQCILGGTTLKPDEVYFTELVCRSDLERHESLAALGYGAVYFLRDGDFSAIGRVLTNGFIRAKTSIFPWRMRPWSAAKRAENSHHAGVTSVG